MNTINRIQKWRTIAFKIAFPALLIENVLTGKKPNELCSWTGISVIGILGVILIIIGSLIRLWARGHFVKGKLFTTGPYAIVRHPLYLGSSLIMIGVLCILNSWLNWFIIIPMIILFHGASILYEENRLNKRFGLEWFEYKHSVPAIIPSFRKHLPLNTTDKWGWQIYYNTTEKTATILFLSLPVFLELFEEIMFK